MAKNTSDLHWDPENETFWESKGKRIAYRNLWISAACLFIAFSTWVMLSTIVVNLRRIGFNFTSEQLFTLAAVPGITGAILRVFYSFTAPVFGGRNWTVVSTLSLLIPTVGLGYAVQHLDTSYTTFLVLAACCGFGGGNFSSSMANISFFFPKKSQGTVLGLNAGIGNLGVSGLQFITPLVLGVSLFGAIGGASQTWTGGPITKQVWLQNVAYVWIIPILLCAIFAYFGMTNLHSVKASISEQLVIFKRKHFYITTLLYVMSFGSFIGFSVSLPLLIHFLFNDIDPLPYAFLGPLLGGLSRPIGGWLSDKKNSGAFVSLIGVALMIAAIGLMVYFIRPEHRSFAGFLSSVLILFFTTGVVNGAIFRMIGFLFVPKEKAPALGMTAAIAAIGAFFVPQMFALSIDKSGGINIALGSFAAYYVFCFIKCWWFYHRKNATAKC